jgi:branched-chain amino acid transport system substrate-binding protein
LPPYAPLEEIFVIARRLIAFAFACLLTATLGTVPAAAQPVPYEINVILALTGPAAFIGKAEQQSLQLLEGILNKDGGIYGRPIKFAIVDDASNPAVTVQLANGLIAKHIPVILGPTFTATCLAVGPLVKDGPVDYCFSPAIAPPAGSYQYSATVSTPDDARALVRFFREKGWTKLGLIATTDASGQQFAASLDDALKLPENKSTTLVGRENFTPTDLSAAALAERIKAANPQAVIAWAAGTPTGTILRGMHDVGLDVPTLIGNGNMIHAQLAQYAAFLPKVLFFPGRASLVYDPDAPAPVRAAAKTYFDAFKSIDAKPNFATALSWDPAMIVIDGLKKIGPNGTAAQLNDFIQHQNHWAGINGFYDFTTGNQRGLGLEAVVMDRWDPATSDFVIVSKGGGALK